jgi:hypothetical protein
MAGLMNALVDRHDVTAAREQQAPPAAGPSADGLIVAELLAVVRRLGEQLISDRSSVTQLCVTDREPAQFQMRNFPVPGAQRLIVRRPGQGGSYTLAANTPTLIAAANENRLGLTIVNGSAHAITLFGAADLLEPGSSSPLAGGAPQAILPAGATWDGRLGNLFWCGSVLAIDTAGGAVVSVWEV